MVEERYSRTTVHEVVDEEDGIHNVGSSKMTAMTEMESGELDQAVSVPSSLSRHRKRCSLSAACLFWNFVFPSFIILATAWGLWIAFGDGDWLPFRSAGETNVGYDSDPFLGLNTNRTYSWMRNTTKNKQGLSLQILNALDSTYQETFDMVLADWDNGDPDALALKVRHSRDFGTCHPVHGKLKVCNGNYGPNGRNGETLLTISKRTGLIIAAIALLNDFYLGDAPETLRRYTLCHELGHGFGLPHTDEDFDNQNLGNCMDYTNKPSSNIHPDQSNYDTLVRLYGYVS